MKINFVYSTFSFSVHTFVSRTCNHSEIMMEDAVVMRMSMSELCDTVKRILVPKVKSSFCLMSMKHNAIVVELVMRQME